MGIKIVIVGGSLTGLSLANMLEQHGIDYILLEAYPAIAPQLGASIGIAPNGLRILDQLGCYEPIRDAAGDYDKGIEIRDLNGNVLFSKGKPGWATRFEEKTGYPLLFIDRQMLLQVLFDKIKHKDRVITGKRVVQVEMDDGSARVHTQDGSIYEGDIVVGADGVHSATRAEMWRLANQQCPGTFGVNEELSLEASAKFIFGISKIPTDFPSGMQQVISSKGLSYMVTPGPGDRLYWFLFVSMPTTPSKLIPKWTKEDEEELAAQRFGDIYRNRRATALVSLEEHVFPRWHFKRIITIGDSAHKVHPLTTLGGNGAMESAALLCNALARMLEQKPGRLQNADMEKVFVEVENRQVRRAQDIVKEGKAFQRWVNQLYPLSGLVLRCLLWFGNESLFLRGMLNVCLAGPRIERLSMQDRPHSLPWQDEDLEPRPRANWAVRSAGMLALATIGYHVAHRFC